MPFAVFYYYRDGGPSRGVERETAKGVDGVGVVLLFGDGVLAVDFYVLEIGKEVARHLVHEELGISTEVFVVLGFFCEGAGGGADHEVEGVLIGYGPGRPCFGIDDDGVA